MSENKGHTNADYLAVYERLGSMKAVAREMGEIGRASCRERVSDYV